LRDLLVIVPSRGRPGRLREMLRACADRAGALTDIVIGLDDDDAGAYAEVTREEPGIGVEWVTGPRDTLTGWTNRLAAPRAARYRAVASLGDDHIPRTPGWDRLLLAALDAMGGTGIAYPDDRRRADVPEAAVISSDIIRALGWMCLPSVRHFYCDDAWADLGRGAGCLAYVPEAVVEHMHHATRRDVARDATYAEAEAGGAADLRAYRAWRAGPMGADIETVRALREGAAP
jgi:hypothetical protein